MKKILFFSAAVVLFIGMSSCRKLRTCTCTYVDGSGSYVNSYPLTTKKNAQAYCDADQTAGYTTCELN